MEHRHCRRHCCCHNSHAAIFFFVFFYVLHCKKANNDVIWHVSNEYANILFCPVVAGFILVVATRCNKNLLQHGQPRCNELFCFSYILVVATAAIKLK